MPHPSHRSFVAGAALLVLAACGSSTASSTSSSAPVTAAAATTASSAEGSSTTSAASAGKGTGCEGAADAARAVIGDTPTVKEIKVIGGCMVSISTTLEPGADGATAALALCDKASEAAYAAGAKSFSVDSAVQHELAAGLKGSRCIGEP